ncbi:unnamed protein product, partial [Polarella glacialis]
MSWSASPEAEHFVILVFKKREDDTAAATQIINCLEDEIRAHGGKIQLRNDRPEQWEILDGQDNYLEPNHLNPAIFDFDTIMLAAFQSSEYVQTWWNSDAVFNLLKYRVSVEKMGIFTVDGLIPAFDVQFKSKMAFGDKLMFLEFLKLKAFKPMQQYVDNYKRFASQAVKDIGTACHLLFAEGISGVLMNDFPIEAACASSWRTRQDAHMWYESNTYQEKLMPDRSNYARCFTLVVPIFS